jgi:hypothetical protein
MARSNAWRDQRPSAVLSMFLDEITRGTNLAQDEDGTQPSGI